MNDWVLQARSRLGDLKAGQLIRVARNEQAFEGLVTGHGIESQRLEMTFAQPKLTHLHGMGFRFYVKECDF